MSDLPEDKHCRHGRIERFGIQVDKIRDTWREGWLCLDCRTEFVEMGKSGLEAEVHIRTPDPIPESIPDIVLKRLVNRGRRHLGKRPVEIAPQELIALAEALLGAQETIALLEAKNKSLGTLHLTCPFEDSEKFSFHTQEQVDAVRRHFEAHALKTKDQEIILELWANEIQMLKQQLASAKELIEQYEKGK